jgi:hypothetical protein
VVLTDPNEADKVFGNRMTNFLKLGFPELEASILAESDADWHEAKDLIDHGCPVDIAYDILT